MFPERTESGNVVVLTDFARQKANIYKFLSLVYVQEPDLEFLETCRSPEVRAILADLGIFLDDDFVSRPVQSLREDLVVEYTRLFIGPGPRVYPYESVYADAGGTGRGLLYGESTVRTIESYRREGYSFEARYPALPDHIGVQLEFLHLLASREAEAREKGDLRTAEDYAARQDVFLQEHLVGWVPRFCEQVLTKGRLPFYRQMAVLTREVISYLHGQGRGGPERDDVAP